MKPLQAGEVRVFAVATERLAAEEVEAAAEILDAEESARAARKLDADDRRVFQIAHALLRRALSGAAPLPPEGWRFTRTAHDRPVLVPEHGRDLTFSLTHTKGLAACAVARGLEIGVDAEHLDRRFGAALERRCFTASELGQLEGVEPGKRSESALAMFTLKEAYTKARGLGLTLGLQAFSVRLDPPVLVLAPADDRADAWRMDRRFVAPRHSVALAVRASGAPVSIAVSLGMPRD